jgi:hypothetical protein
MLFALMAVADHHRKSVLLLLGVHQVQNSRVDTNVQMEYVPKALISVPSSLETKSPSKLDVLVS